MKVKINTPQGSFESEAQPGLRLDDLILSAGLLIDRPCGGRGKCGKCRVRVAGAVSPITDRERKVLTAPELDSGLRLACHARAAGDLEIHFDRYAPSTDKTFTLGHDISKIPGPLGLAVDLGTTTVAVILTSLEDGRVLAGNAAPNRQGVHGADVMSRLSAAEQDAYILRQLAWDSIRDAAAGLGLAKEDRDRVQLAVVAGNSAMHHLAMGLPIGTLIRSPFEPCTTASGEAPGGELSKLFPHLGRIIIAPLIGGFVGSDALACMVYFGIQAAGRDDAMVIDLGTNGEVMLSSGGRVFAASAAAGPAFEAVNISCGVRAVPGAVTALEWSDQSGVRMKTIGGKPPRGFCGSGLVSAVNLLRRLEAVNPAGRIDENFQAPGLAVTEADGIRRVVFSSDAYITQLDIRELQKAKAAIRAAADLLLLKAQVPASKLQRVILTGSFGGRVGPADALDLGVIPPAAPARVLSIPNGAGMGAAMMLDPQTRRMARELAPAVEHVELNLEPDFMERFVAAMSLGRDPKISYNDELTTEV